MRAHEFVREKISPETTETGFKDQRDIADGRYRLVATGHNTVYRDRPVNMLKVDLFDNELERNIAWVEFIVQTREQDQEPHLVSTSTYVRPEYRNQGLAKIMYQYANSIGNDIEPSRLQTQAGKNMWKGLTKSVKQLPPLPEPPPPPPKPTVWQRLRGAVGAKSKEFAESVDADQVLQYVKRVHAPDEFNIEYSITDHPKWELKSIPLSRLKLDPEGEHRDPYNRVNWVDYDKVQDLIPQITSVLKTMPIVVDSDGWIIDGNHRATAAAEAGLKSVPAYVPAEVNENFADGKVKGKSRPGRVKRAGASCAGSVTDLRAKARKYGGEKGKMYHWCANMKGGKKK